MQGESRGPITAYINSRGGNIHQARTLESLLRAPGIDGEPSCRLITVVPALAASAAALMLASGDYVIALPESRILFHGTRIAQTETVTTEAASELSWTLRALNEDHATKLLKRIQVRMMFRLIMTSAAFEGSKLDAEAFFGLIKSRLSGGGSAVFDSARERCARYRQLLRCVRDQDGTAASEAKMLKAIVSFELRTNKLVPGWSFRGLGLPQVTSDFYLVSEHLASSAESFATFYKRWSRFLEEAGDEELDQLWIFVVAFCHVLQAGEHVLTASDAFWLGIVDEVVGLNELTQRQVVEYQPEASEPPAPQDVSTAE